MILPLVGLLVGILIGVVMPFEFPAGYSTYIAIGILACMDSVLGGIKAHFQKRFDVHLLLSGFFGNAVIAMALTFLGEKLNIQLIVAALVVYGVSLFQNFAFIRRYLLLKNKKEANI